MFQFGAVKAGVVLPQSAIDQYHAGQPFTVANDVPGQWGHDIPIFGYDADWLYTVTWGAPKQLSWDWFWMYIEEMYTVLTPDWKPILGFDLPGFTRDMKAVTA